MGRKSTKAAKERKQRRLEENARLSAMQQRVDDAKKLEDPMALLQPFKKFERNGLSLAIQCYKPGDIDTETKDFLFGLCKENMQKLYEESEWGWKDRERRDEMFEENARYLIVRDGQQAAVAFVHFRFDIEIDEEVIYCYEIQLTKEVRRKGLGKFLMQILELMAFKTGMVKVMLTLFKHNLAGKKFFMDALKYQIDDSSMGDCVYEEECCYDILSKTIKTKAQAAKKPLEKCCTRSCKISTCNS